MAETLTPDICIIGGGPAGLAAAEAARALDASVVLVERHKMGGNGLHAGAIASKALNAAARNADLIRTAGRFGIAAEDVRVHFGRIRDGIAELVAASLPEHSSERFEALGVQVLKGKASFLDQRTLQVGETAIRARRFVLASGSRPDIPAIPGLEKIAYFTTDTIFTNTRRPAHLLVIGGTAIGLEIAQSYARLGSRVTLVEQGRLLHGSDSELAEVVLRRVAEDGVALRPLTSVTELSESDAGIGAVLTSRDGDTAASETLVVSHVLVTTGRVPELEGLDLDKARIAMAADGRTLVIKNPLRTTNGRVYAIGDVSGSQPFAHVGIHQARQVVANALLGTRIEGDTGAIAMALFTDPEIAEVGVTEIEARTRLKDDYIVLRSAFSENHRARAERTTYGVAKLVCSRDGRILGAGIVGPGAAEISALFALAVASKLPVGTLQSFAAPYPTLSEIAHRLAAEFGRGRELSALQRRRLALQRRLP